MITLKQEYEIKTGERVYDPYFLGGGTTADYTQWLEDVLTNERVRSQIIIDGIITLRLEVHHENETMLKCTGSRSVGYTHVIETLDAISGISDSQPPLTEANTTKQ